MTARAAAEEQMKHVDATRRDVPQAAEESTAPGSGTGASARPDQEMRCTLCGLKACWTES